MGDDPRKPMHPSAFSRRCTPLVSTTGGEMPAPRATGRGGQLRAGTAFLYRGRIGEKAAAHVRNRLGLRFRLQEFGAAGLWVSVLVSCFSKRVPWSSSVSTHWELVARADSRAPPQNVRFRQRPSAAHAHRPGSGSGLDALNFGFLGCEKGTMTHRWRCESCTEASKTLCVRRGSAKREAVHTGNSSKMQR